MNVQPSKYQVWSSASWEQVSRLFDAYDDPEWQCNIDASFYGGFNGLPDHCQNRILMNLSIPLTDIFGWHQSSLSKISIELDSPMRGIEGGRRGDSYAMKHALASTKKTFSFGIGSAQNKKLHSIGEFVVNVSDIPDFIDANVGNPIPWGDHMKDFNDASTGDPLHFVECQGYLPTAVPPGVSVDANIEVARAKYFELSKPLGPIGEPGERAATATRLIVESATWFRSMVDDGAAWDYKYADADHAKYQAFGNFNYGATGAALGFTLGTLQRMAGWQQQYGNNGAKEYGSGSTPETQIQAFAGVGGVYPFGDEEIDSRWIAEGIKYYECTRKNSR